MLVKCHEHLHPSLRNLVDEDFFLLRLHFGYIWTTTTTNELTKELVERELVIFKYYQPDVKEIECPFNGGINMKQCFVL